MWAKLDGAIFYNRKVMRVGKDAKLLYIAGLAHCAHELTDGAIEGDEMRALARLIDVDPEAAKELVNARLWKATKDGFHVHDWDKYNPPASEAKQKKADAEAAKSAGRQKGYKNAQRGERGRFQAREHATAYEPLEAVEPIQFKRPS